MWNPLGTITGTPLVLCITAAASSGFLLFGYDNSVFSGLIVAPYFLKTFNNPNATLLGTVSALYNVGCAIGALVAFVVGSYLGRRKTILTGSASTAVGVIIQASSKTIAQLLVGRIVTGIGVGILTSTVGLWQAETSPARSRGRYMTLELFLGGFGLIFAQWINYGLRNYTTQVAFILPICFQLIFVVVTGILVLLLPESPRWLVKKDRTDEALGILARLEGKGATRDTPSVRQHLVVIREAHLLESRQKGVLGGIFTNGPTQNFRRVCLGTGIMIFHQLNGINSVTYYVPTLVITFIGASHSDALWIAGLTSVWVVVFSTIPVLAVDKFGRRVFLWLGSALQAVCFVIVAALFGTEKSGDQRAHGIATLSFIYIYYAINVGSWFGITWLYPAELMPLHIREKGMGIAVIFYWLFQFMMVEVTPIALTDISYKFYIILACFNVAIAVIIYFVYPETKGKTLEEIDFYFASKYHGGQELRDVENEIRRHEESLGTKVDIKLTEDVMGAGQDGQEK